MLTSVTPSWPTRPGEELIYINGATTVFIDSYWAAASEQSCVLTLCTAFLCVDITTHTLTHHDAAAELDSGVIYGHLICRRPQRSMFAWHNERFGPGPGSPLQRAAQWNGSSTIATHTLSILNIHARHIIGGGFALTVCWDVGYMLAPYTKPPTERFCLCTNYRPASIDVVVVVRMSINTIRNASALYARYTILYIIFNWYVKQAESMRSSWYAGSITTIISDPNRRKCIRFAAQKWSSKRRSIRTVVNSGIPNAVDWRTTASA